MKKILQVGETPVLRQKAQEVSIEEIGSTKIQNLIADLKESLASQEDGVALSAPQIGVPLRVFIVSKKAFAIENHGEESEDHETLYEDQVYINPTITKTSSKKIIVEEGCLSVRGLYGKVERAEKTTVRAYDEHGKPFTRGGSGLLSQIFQHETDHLNGILFIDIATDIQEV